MTRFLPDRQRERNCEYMSSLEWKLREQVAAYLNPEVPQSIECFGECRQVALNSITQACDNELLLDRDHLGCVGGVALRTNLSSGSAADRCVMGYITGWTVRIRSREGSSFRPVRSLNLKWIASIVLLLAYITCKGYGN